MPCVLVLGSKQCTGSKYQQCKEILRWVITITIHCQLRECNIHSDVAFSPVSFPRLSWWAHYAGLLASVGLEVDPYLLATRSEELGVWSLGGNLVTIAWRFSEDLGGHWTSESMGPIERSMAEV